MPSKNTSTATSKTKSPTKSKIGNRSADKRLKTQNVYSRLDFRWIAAQRDKGRSNRDIAKELKLDESNLSTYFHIWKKDNLAVKEYATNPTKTFERIVERGTSIVLQLLMDIQEDLGDNSDDLTTHQKKELMRSIATVSAVFQDKKSIQEEKKNTETILSAIVNAINQDGSLFNQIAAAKAQGKLEDIINPKPKHVEVVEVEALNAPQPDTDTTNNNPVG